MRRFCRVDIRHRQLHDLKELGRGFFCANALLATMRWVVTVKPKSFPSGSWVLSGLLARRR